MPELNLKQFDSYIGDGVYASFDGYQIWLAANHHENKIIALDPDVQKSLINYINKLNEFLKSIYEGVKSAQ